MKKDDVDLFAASKVIATTMSEVREQVKVTRMRFTPRMKTSFPL